MRVDQNAVVKNMQKRIKLILLFSVILLFTCSVAGILLVALRQRGQSATMKEAKLAFDARDYGKAKEQLLEIVRRNPAEESAYRMLAEIFESEFSSLNSFYCYSQAISLSPQDTALRIRYAELLNLFSDYPSVITSLREAYDHQELLLPVQTVYLNAVLMDQPEQTWHVAALEKMKSAAPDLGNYLEAVHELRKGNFEKSLKQLEHLAVDKLPVYLRYKRLSYLGGLASRLGQNELAERSYLQLAQQAPALGAFMLGDFYVGQSRYADAEKWFEMMHRLHPDDTGILPSLAEVYAAGKKRDALRVLSEELVPRNKSDAEVALYLSAMEAFLDGQYRECSDILKLTPALETRRFARMMRFSIVWKTGDLDQLEQAARNFKNEADSPEVRQSILALLKPLLISHFNAGDLVSAVKVAKAVVSVSTDQSPVTELAWNVLLTDASSRHDYPRMELLATQILGHTPTHAMALLAMADSMISRGRAEEGMVYLAKLPQDQGQTFFLRALAAEQLGQTEDALRYYRQAWHLFPGDATLFQNYADFLMKQKRYSDLNALFAALPDHPEMNYCKFYLQSVEAKAKGDRMAEASFRSSAIESLRKMQKTPLNRYRLAFLLATSGKDQEAANLYRPLLKEYPNWLELLVNLSEVEAAIGNPEQALLLAEKAVRLAPDSRFASACLKRRMGAGGNSGGK